MTIKTQAPFRADQVGSLLRTETLKRAREQHASAAIDDVQLREIEDAEIIKLIRRQEEIGFRSVTDGEFRRAWWHFDFLEHLPGVTGVVEGTGIAFHGINTKNKQMKVTGPISYAPHPMVEHFRFLKAHTTATPKMTIPSPSMLHYRSGRAAIDATVYPELDGFYHDLGEAYRGAVADFADAGCRYLQLDDVSFAYFCDPEQKAMLAKRGDDPDKQPGIYAEMINRAIAGRPSDMIVSMHMCRGNFRSTFIASGGYEPIAELLFNAVDVDAYFMEWDTERAGGFEPLRFLPKGKTVVLGLVTTKHGELESRDALMRRIDEAARFAPLDQLCLSPQCGLASTEEGNTLADQAQWAKLILVADVAREVWGSA